MIKFESFIKGFLDNPININEQFTDKVQTDVSSSENYGKSAGYFLIKYLNYDFQMLPTIELKKEFIQIEYNSYKKILSNSEFVEFMKNIEIDDIFDNISAFITKEHINSQKNKIVPFNDIIKYDYQKEAINILNKNADKIKYVSENNVKYLIFLTKLFYYSSVDYISINQKA